MSWLLPSARSRWVALFLCARHPQGCTLTAVTPRMGPTCPSGIILCGFISLPGPWQSRPCLWFWESLAQGQHSPHLCLASEPGGLAQPARPGRVATCRLNQASPLSGHQRDGADRAAGLAERDALRDGHLQVLRDLSAAGTAWRPGRPCNS